MRRRYRVTPPRASMVLSLIVGVIFCILGVTVVIPSAGLFGVFWTLVAACITAANALPLFTDKAGYREISIEDDSDIGDMGDMYDEASSGALAPPSDTKRRLTELTDLYNSGLISRDEYDAKREEILKKL